MADFKPFADAVRVRFAEMSNEDLFVVDADRDVIWDTYLRAFPAGTDPIFRERTTHDCSCCRHFIRDVGPVVAIINGVIATVWDLNGLSSPYQEVADAMAAHIRSLPIRDVFVYRQTHAGTALSHERIDSGVLTWEHFAVDVSRKFVSADGDTIRGDARMGFAVLRRALVEFTPDAVETVLDLINQGSLYRGDAAKNVVTDFYRLQQRFNAASDRDRDNLVWLNARGPLVTFRNSAIGTLVQDLSEGSDLERAVRAYETKVAPEHYRRPTAIITKKMVDDAVAKLRELGLEDALERRHAKLSDVSVNSVLFVDNAVRSQMRDVLTDTLMEEVRPEAPNLDRAEEITIDDFIRDVLPKCKTVQVHVENRHLGNFVSMTAPVHDNVAPLFTWDNNFAWSYEGNVTDSIKERVKRAGGRVEGVALRASLAWYNYDDLDIHAIEPDGNHIYYGNKSGKLDVDMNAGSGHTREAVENVRWTGRLQDGIYEIFVHQFSRRESVDVGFEVEIESSRGVDTFRYDKGMNTNARILVASVRVHNGRVIDILPSRGVQHGATPREQWGVTTEGLARANAIVLSPNHWDDNAAGNCHWFFVLDGCKNPVPTRGIYNEFLRSDLAKHRKVFEVLGDKTKCAPADDQISGVGFTKGRGDSVTVAVSGQRMNKVYTIKF